MVKAPGKTIVNPLLLAPQEQVETVAGGVVADMFHGSRGEITGVRLGGGWGGFPAWSWSS